MVPHPVDVGPPSLLLPPSFVVAPEELPPLDEPDPPPPDDEPPPDEPEPLDEDEPLEVPAPLDDPDWVTPPLPDEDEAPLLAPLELDAVPAASGPVESEGVELVPQPMARAARPTEAQSMRASVGVAERGVMLAQWRLRSESVIFAANQGRPVWKPTFAITAVMRLRKSVTSGAFFRPGSN